MYILCKYQRTYWICLKIFLFNRSCLPPHQQDWDKVNLLMHFWRLPSIHLDEILECTCDKKDTSKIKRRFVIKIVPRQATSNSIKMTLDHIEKATKELKIENKVICEILSESRPWYEDCRYESFCCVYLYRISNRNYRLYHFRNRICEFFGSRIVGLLTTKLLEGPLYRFTRKIPTWSGRTKTGRCWLCSRGRLRNHFCCFRLTAETRMLETRMRVCL